MVYKTVLVGNWYFPVRILEESDLTSKSVHSNQNSLFVEQHKLSKRQTAVGSVFQLSAREWMRESRRDLRERNDMIYINTVLITSHFGFILNNTV